MDTYLLYAVGAGVLALAYGLFLVINILKQPDGEGKMVEIAEAIQAGAKAYLNRQYRTVGIVALIIIGVMWLANFLLLSPDSCSVLSCPPWRDSSV